MNQKSDTDTPDKKPDKLPDKNKESPKLDPKKGSGEVPDQNTPAPKH
jgi:hypothetical protein